MNMNATLFGQAITFVLFVWFCMKYVWPPLINAIEKRQKEIADGLSSASVVQTELELAKKEAEKLLKDARIEANTIIEQANKHRDSIINKAQQEATLEKDKIVEKGFLEIESERKRVTEELKTKVSQLAIAGAEKIIERSIDEAANSDIIDKLVAEL